MGKKKQPTQPSTQSTDEPAALSELATAQEPNIADVILAKLKQIEANRKKAFAKESRRFFSDVQALLSQQIEVTQATSTQQIMYVQRTLSREINSQISGIRSDTRQALDEIRRSTLSVQIANRDFVTLLRKTYSDMPTKLDNIEAHLVTLRSVLSEPCD